jgi:uncharacterized protein
VLVVTGGHRVDLDAFLAMVESISADCGWTWAHVTQPGAQRWFDPGQAGCWDAILCHDIPGLALRRGTPPRVEGPTPRTADALIALLERGQGIVALHHALAGWPAWEGWAEALGGRFLYAPGELRGTEWPASGYRMAEHTIDVVAPEHPICAGVGSFTVDDELYYAPVLADRVTPLLRSRDDFDGSRFLDAYDVVCHGESTGQTCAGRPPASDLVGWTTTAGRSPIAVLQPGDGASTFANPTFRVLVHNALAWVASPAARAQAAARPFAIPPMASH